MLIAVLYLSYFYPGVGCVGSNCTTYTTTSTGISTTVTSTWTSSSSACPSTPCPFYNANSQKVADLIVKYGWHSEVGLLADVNEPGCVDYVGGFPCNNTFWTTSDTAPTCWTLGDYGYASIMNQCQSRLSSLGAFSNPRDGQRYESYVGSLIIPGNACCTHTILQPNGNDVKCPQTGCSGYAYGTLANGQQYAIQSDAWNGAGPSRPQTGVSVDIEGPQAINEWLLGNKAEGQNLANDLVQRMVSSNWIGAGSTWQLGQVLFVMRVYGMDISNPSAFSAGVSRLWSLQDSNGYLPNSYSVLGRGSGHDPENMDAGLLPFSYSSVTLVQNDFGLYSSSPYAGY